MKRDRTTLLWNFDLEQADAGRIAGMDEAGRGPLAGPVVAACVSLPLDEPIPGVDDSKKLSAKKREALYEEITRRALSWGVGIVDESAIDKINILNATKRAMEQAWENMGARTDILLIDAVKGLHIDTQLRPMVKGDATSYHVAAASILAKVTRDRLMAVYDAQYPAYGFAAHMGYGTARHLAALAEYGPCPIHRRTFLKNLRMTSVSIGKAGEDWAQIYLMALGYQVLEANFKTRQGEVDLIARRDDMLVFCEVKARKKGTPGRPREAVDAAKQEKIAKAAMEYIAGQDVPCQCRFDVMEIIYEETGHELLHLKNAFAPEGGRYAL